MNNHPQEVQVLNQQELEQITQEMASTQPTKSKAQEQIIQESKVITEQAMEGSKKQLDSTVKDIQIMYFMVGVTIIAIGVIKILVECWIKKTVQQKKKPKKMMRITKQ